MHIEFRSYPVGINVQLLPRRKIERNGNDKHRFEFDIESGAENIDEIRIRIHPLGIMTSTFDPITEALVIAARIHLHQLFLGHFS